MIIIMVVMVDFHLKCKNTGMTKCNACEIRVPFQTIGEKDTQTSPVPFQNLAVTQTWKKLFFSEVFESDVMVRCTCS